MAAPISNNYVHNLRPLPGAGTLLWRSAVPGNHAKTAPHLADPLLGIKTVVDLREPYEQQQYPDVLPAHIQYLSAPLYQGQLPTASNLQTVYRQLTKQQAQQVAVACNLIISNADSGVLLHCTAGKDRTGLITALLLTAAKQPLPVVLADYALSASMLPESFTAAAVTEIAAYAKPGTPAYAAAVKLHTQSPAAALEKTLTELIAAHGSIANYLLAAGVTAANLQRLQQLFTSTAFVKAQDA